MLGSSSRGILPVDVVHSSTAQHLFGCCYYVSLNPWIPILLVLLRLFVCFEFCCTISNRFGRNLVPRRVGICLSIFRLVEFFQKKLVNQRHWKFEIERASVAIFVLIKYFIAFGNLKYKIPYSLNCVIELHLCTYFVIELHPCTYFVIEIFGIEGFYTTI